MNRKLYILLLALYITGCNAENLTQSLSELAKSLQHLEKIMPGQEFNLAELLEKSGYVKEKKIIAGYPVYILNVLRQRGGDCQLHALKNAIYGLKLLKEGPENFTENLRLMNDRNLYEKLLSTEAWGGIITTCDAVPDSDLNNVLNAIKNKITLPQDLYWTPDYISYFDTKSFYHINPGILGLFKKTLQERKNLSDQPTYLHSFLAKFINYNKSNPGNPANEPQHAFAIITYKQSNNILFLVGDSFEGSLQNQKNMTVEFAVRSMTMQDKQFYLWFGDYTLQEAKDSLQLGQKNNIFVHWLVAAFGTKIALDSYQMANTPLTQQKKKAICQIAEVLLNNEEMNTLAPEYGLEEWNIRIEQIKKLLQDLKISC